jgi:predicted AlkP superfamily phosphohydrolase/phosphomutase
MRSATHPRVLLVGLDGADWSVLRLLFADGAMPTLEALVRDGVSAVLESVTPTNSMAAWTSLMTGVNPGKHGMFGFVRNTGTPFRTSVMNSHNIRFPTMWETLAGQGLRASVIDMPPLFPPLRIDGVTMLGGFVPKIALSLGTSLAYPPEVEATVEQAGGFLPDGGWADFRGRRAELVERLVAIVDNRVRIAEALLDAYESDVFCVMFGAPDRAQHVFWSDLMEQGPEYPRVRELYVAIDEALARLLERLDPAATDVMVVSDHGFREMSRGFDVNQFLVEAGLMRWKRAKPTKAVIRAAARLLPTPLLSAGDWILRRKRSGTRSARIMRPVPRRLSPDSIAYSDVSDCVNLNLAGRESTGRVGQSEYEDVREMVAAKLVEFRDPATGERPVKRVLRREECMHGEFLDEAPDLILDFADGYGYSRSRSEVRWEFEGWLKGVHASSGIIACRGPHFRRGAEVPPVSILDVAPTVLAMFGVASAPDLGGRIAEELLAGPPPPVSEPAAPLPKREEQPATFSEEEEELLKDRLRGLGYID